MNEIYAPGYFYGNDSEDAEEFIIKFEAYFSINNDINLARVFCLALKGKSFVWLKSLEEEKKQTFGSLKQAFLERYTLNENFKFVKVGHIFTEKQKDNEKAQDYYSRVIAACKSAGLNSDMQRQAVMQGMHNGLRGKVMLQEPKTLKDLEHCMDMIQTMEDLQIESNELSASIKEMKDMISTLTEEQSNETLPPDPPPRVNNMSTDRGKCNQQNTCKVYNSKRNCNATNVNYNSKFKDQNFRNRF